MANVPTIPPLLSTTPPPIDFEDDSGLPPTPHNLDDEFGDFAIAEEEDTNDDSLNVNVMSLPVTPLHQEHSNVIGAIYPNSSNYNCGDPYKIVMQDQNLNESSMKMEIPLDSSNDTENENRNDGLLSKFELKETYLNIQKSSTDESSLTSKNTLEELNNIVEDVISSGTSNVDVSLVEDVTKEPCAVIDDSNTSEIGQNIITDNRSLVISTENNVILEDILDDSSDDETVKLKTKIFFTDENSEDFFTIHALENSKRTGADESILQNKSFQENETIPNNKSISHNESVLHNEDIVKNENIMEQQINKISFTENIEDDDYNDFACFDKVDSNVQQTTYNNMTITPISKDFTFEADFDQFYNQPSITNSERKPQGSITETTVEEKNPILEGKLKTSVSADEADGSDDDFGEFTDSTSNQVLSNNLEINMDQSVEKKLNLHLDNINERLNHVLEIMFPKGKDEDLEINVTKKDFNTNAELHSIDSAKALEYQWVNSQMRDALIKSLGIDCRNILFGEKWNSSMPRFAANLSYDPLQPTKSLTSTSTHDQQLKEKSQIQASKSTDIPTVDFDWNTSGLVNPLEGSKESTQTKEENKGLYVTETGEFSSFGEQQISDDSSSFSAKSDTATTASTNACATTTTTLSTNVSTDSVSNSFDKNGFHTNINKQTANDNCTFDTPKIECFDVNTFHTSEHSLQSNEPIPYINSTSSYPEVSNEDDEVVTTCTYSGPLKETHIYTPPKGEAIAIRTIRSTNIDITKPGPIDFDYEKAAAGIVIDEKVVTKEYRDIEYNPNFTSIITESNKFGIPSNTVATSCQLLQSDFKNSDGELNAGATLQKPKSTDYDDDFSDFQSVPPTATIEVASNSGSFQATKIKSSTSSRTSTPSVIEEMILSPTILLPQAISMENSKVKIEWGDTVKHINPEELARIEELFPQPKFHKTKELNSPHKSLNTHNEKSQQNFISISATIARKEQNCANDDDEWTDFVSVPVATTINERNSNINYISGSNNNTSEIANVSPRKSLKTNTRLNNCENNVQNINDDDWSDFVSSTPKSNGVLLSNTHIRTTKVPQFNSGAWQNANFYNNPLSFYHQKPTNAFSQPAQATQHLQTPLPGVLKFQNNNYSDKNINQYNQYQPHHQQQQLSQIHIMQDMSVTHPTRAVVQNSGTTNINQFQVGAARVAPSISLIPDFGFIAPAVPSHTTFINSLPKPSFNIKK